MRPLKLNADSSAISRMLPQRGHLGRRKLWAAGSGVLQASCKVIVDSPRRSHTPHLSRCCYHAWPLWRCHDAIMKLSWPVGANFGRNDNAQARICIKLRTGLQLLLRPRKLSGATVWRISPCARHVWSNASRAAASLRCSGPRRAAPGSPARQSVPVHSAARASACWRKRGMTSSAMSCIDCRSQASLGPSQSTPVMSNAPKGPTSSRNATSLSSMVLGEP
jgi:hypothetical protein